MRSGGAGRNHSFFQTLHVIRGGNSENVYVVTRDGATSVVIYFGETRVSNGYSDYGTAQTVARSWIHAQLDWKTRSSPEQHG